MLCFKTTGILEPLERETYMLFASVLILVRLAVVYFSSNISANEASQISKERTKTK